MGRSVFDTRGRAVLVAAALGMLAGCGGRSGTLSGRVSHQNKPVVYGTVMVFGADRITRSGNLGPDGTYTVADVPVGPVQVAVVSPEPPDAKPAAKHDERPRRGPAAAPLAAVDRSKWFRIPEKYGDPEKSGLTTTVQPGGTRYDIPLP